MNVLRTVRDIELNEGNGQAKGLFNLSKEDNVSFWFDIETKDRLMKLNDADFWHQAKDIIKQDSFS